MLRLYPDTDSENTRKKFDFLLNNEILNRRILGVLLNFIERLSALKIFSSSRRVDKERRAVQQFNDYCEEICFWLRRRDHGWQDRCNGNDNITNNILDLDDGRLVNANNRKRRSFNAERVMTSSVAMLETFDKLRRGQPFLDKSSKTGSYEIYVEDISLANSSDSSFEDPDISSCRALQLFRDLRAPRSDD